MLGLVCVGFILFSLVASHATPAFNRVGHGRRVLLTVCSILSSLLQNLAGSAVSCRKNKSPYQPGYGTVSKTLVTHHLRGCGLSKFQGIRILHRRYAGNLKRWFEEPTGIQLGR